jgi:general L-amino acid transport system permease protein
MTDNIASPGVTGPVKAPPKRSFYDQEVQAVLWQIVVLGAVVLLAAFLIRNTYINLETRSIKTGYGFLARESGFEIGESLISYSAANSYGYALLVGFLNTIHVSIIGIAAATILGILIGVAMLSRNWLISRLAMGYVHFLRNIPVLLQIILWYSILISERFLPGPRQAEPLLGAYATQRGIYFPVPEHHVAWLAALVGFGLGLIGMVFAARWAKARREATGQEPPLIWLALALLVGLPVASWAVAGAPTAISWPELRGFNLSGGGRITPEFTAVLFGLSVYTSAFIAEIVRSGIMAVPKGQVEAARALGLREGVILHLVTLPQALRVIVPPLTNQYLNLIKNSSLSVAIGYPDLVNVANTTINQTGQAIEGISIIMVVYLTTSLITSAIMNWYNERKKLVER